MSYDARSLKQTNTKCSKRNELLTLVYPPGILFPLFITCNAELRVSAELVKRETYFLTGRSEVGSARVGGQIHCFAQGRFSTSTVNKPINPVTADFTTDILLAARKE